MIKSLLASQLVYILTPLPTQQKALEEINRALYTFLWDGRGDKIKRTEMINDYEKGGLKMLDIQIFNRALKSIWIQKYLDDNNTGKWKLIFDFYLSKQGGKHLFSGNLRTKDVQNLGLGNEFLNEILCIWAEINFQETLCDFQNSPLWHNSLIREANQPVFFEKWSNKSINCIKNLLDDNSKFLTLQAFSCKYKIKVNFLDYYGLLSAIRKFKTRSCLGEHNHQNNPLRKLLKFPKISKKVYKILIDRKASTPFKSQDKWKLACGEMNKDIEWNKDYILPFQCTKDTNLQSFQFKLLHRRIATNDFLNKIGVSLSAMCTFCNEYVETLEHVFWECKFSQSFWKNVTEWLTKNLKQLPDLHFSMLTCLGLIPSSTILISHTFLIARRLIYISRLRGVIPKQSAFERLIFKTRELEQNSALQLNELKKFNKKWRDIKFAEPRPQHFENN